MSRNFNSAWLNLPRNITCTGLWKNQLLIENFNTCRDIRDIKREIRNLVRHILLTRFVIAVIVGDKIVLEEDISSK